MNCLVVIWNNNPNVVNVGGFEFLDFLDFLDFGYFKQMNIQESFDRSIQQILMYICECFNVYMYEYMHMHTCI
jgi:hypothetical protein